LDQHLRRRKHEANHARIAGAGGGLPHHVVMMPRAGAALSDRALTYKVVGVTLADGDRFGTQAGFRGYERSVYLGKGWDRWRFASTEVLRWGVKTRSGFAVVGDAGSTSGAGAGEPVVAGRRYWLVAHLGPLRIREPVQVVAVVDEPDRKGFAYGTLAGHPVSGEEAFLLEWRTDGSVWLSVRSVTRPSRGLWRATYPVLHVAQRIYKRRYLRSLVVERF
jgi:uncharacterized protein (UPF0548 family)